MNCMQTSILQTMEANRAMYIKQLQQTLPNLSISFLGIQMVNFVIASSYFFVGLDWSSSLTSFPWFFFSKISHCLRARFLPVCQCGQVSKETCPWLRSWPFFLSGIRNVKCRTLLKKLHLISYLKVHTQALPSDQDGPGPVRPRRHVAETHQCVSKLLAVVS